jgi:hypothetical protein
VHFWHDVLTIDQNRRLSRGPKRNVKHGPVLSHINLLAPEHRVNAFLQAGLLRELDEESDRVICDPILRIVKEQAGGFNGHTSAALRILGEERA